MTVIALALQGTRDYVFRSGLNVSFILFIIVYRTITYKIAKNYIISSVNGLHLFKYKCVYARTKMRLIKCILSNL